MKPRWWPTLLVLALWTAGLLYVWSAESTIRQEKFLSSLAVTVGALFLLTLWLLFFSRLRWKVRLIGFGLAVLLLGGAAASFRIRGVTGDLIPVLEPRWKREVALAGPAASQAGPVHDSADRFPQFQGPRRDGVLAGPRLAANWSAQPPRRLWRREVGAGWAGFAIDGGRAFTQEQRGDQESVTAYDLASGEPLWAYGEKARYETTVGGVGPRSTPTLAGGRLFALGATGQLRALDPATGALLWRRDLLADHAGTPLDWGIPCSPLVLQDHVIVNVHGESALAAYDAASGKLVWRSGAGPASYSSPQLVELDGRRQIVSFNQANLSGHDPDDGRQLWSVPWSQQQPNVALPLALDGRRLFASSGYGVGGKLFEIEPANGSEWTAKLLWESPRLKSKFANVIYHRGAIYGLDDGVLVSLDPASGERHWKAGRYGHGQLLLVGDQLLVFAEDGRVVLIDPQPVEHRELASFQALEGKTWNPPALAGKVLVVRNDREAAAYELPLAAQ